MMTSFQRAICRIFFLPVCKIDEQEKRLAAVNVKRENAEEEMRAGMKLLRTNTFRVQALNHETTFNEKMIDMIGQLSSTLDH